MSARTATFVLLAGCAAHTAAAPPPHAGSAAQEPVETMTDLERCKHAAGAEPHTASLTEFPFNGHQVFGRLALTPESAERVFLDVYMLRCDGAVPESMGGVRIGSMHAAGITDELLVEAEDFYGKGNQALRVEWKDHGGEGRTAFERWDERWIGLKDHRATVLGACIHSWVIDDVGHRGEWTMFTPGFPPMIEGWRRVEGERERFLQVLRPVIETSNWDSCSRDDVAEVKRLF